MGDNDWVLKKERGNKTKLEWSIVFVCVQVWDRDRETETERQTCMYMYMYIPQNGMHMYFKADISN